MALPLPRVVADVEPGGPLVTSMRGMNALTQSNLENQIKSAQAKYAPYTTYADAASKLAYANMVPWQIQATVLSNPLLWSALKDNPGAIQSMLQNFTQSVPKGNQIFGGVQMPAPNMQRSNGLMGMLMDKLTGGSNQQNPMQEMTSPAMGGMGGASGANPLAPSSMGGPALLPSSQGGVAGAMAKMTAPYTQSPYSSGSLIPDPNNPSGAISVPTSKMGTTIQTQLLAAKRVEPQLERIANEWAPFMDLKGKGKLIGSQIGNFFGSSLPKGTLEKIGLPTDSTLPSQYAKAKSTTLTAPEALIKAYGLNATNETLDRLQQAIEPLVGENKSGYKTRIKNILEEIRQDQMAQSQQALGGGFNIPAPQANVQPKQPSNQYNVENDNIAENLTPPRSDGRIKVRYKKDKKKIGWVPADRLEAYENNGYERA